MTKMLMLAASVAALMAIGEPAHSDGLTIVTNGPRGRNWVTTVVPHAGGSIAQIIHLPTTSDYGTSDAWDLRCNPQRYLQQSTGLWRVYFAHQNCGGDTARRD